MRTKLVALLLTCLVVLAANTLIAMTTQEGTPAIVDLPEWMMTLPALIGVGLLGMVTHFLKKQVKGETLTEISGFFSDHFKSTFIAAVVTTVSVIGLYAGFSTGQPIDVITVFLLGFGFDSTLNKWDAKASL